MRKPWSPLPSEESGFPPGCRSRSAPQRLGVCAVSGAGRSWEKRGLGGGPRSWQGVSFWPNSSVPLAGSPALAQAWFPFIRSPSSGRLLEHACLAPSPSSAWRPEG